MGREERHYSNKGGHYARGQADKTRRESLMYSPDGRIVRPNDPPRFDEVYIARRSMRRITQDGRTQGSK